MAKTLGYILALIGLVGIAASVVPEIGAALSLPAEFSNTTFLIVAVVVTLLGVFFITRGGRRRGKGREVPIYHGKDVVGYRRT